MNWYHNETERIYCSAGPLPKTDAGLREIDPRGSRPYDISMDEAVFLRGADPETNRFAFCATDVRQLAAADQLGFLDARRIGDANTVPADLHRRLRNGGVRVENVRHPRFRELTGRPVPATVPCPKGKKVRLHLVALGDVGSTLLVGLKLLGGDVIEELGIYDLNPDLAKRWEIELNQIAYPFPAEMPGGRCLQGAFAGQAGADPSRGAPASLPEARVISEDELFDCDVFVFAASASIPPVGSGVKDVRMAQFAANRKIMRIYAKKARDAHFPGLFCAVSDPVDLLARTAYDESNRDENGVFDGRGLLPEQIQGYGLGVMNARAAYYAKKDAAEREIPCAYLTEGRAYGPHGEGLVIANSLRDYDEAYSESLTKRAIAANLAVRALGYKPYTAPALSSGAISILLTLRGEWHYGSVFLGGNWIGVRNRYGAYGVETEERKLPDALYTRIETAEEILRNAWDSRE